MGRYRSSAVLAAVFAVIFDVACYPIVAPAIACALAGAVFDWPSWIDSIGPDLWLAFWASGAWLPHQTMGA